MFGYLSDFERTFAAMDELRRRWSARVDGSGVRADAFATDTAWPRTSVYENEDGADPGGGRPRAARGRPGAVAGQGRADPERRAQAGGARGTRGAPAGAARDPVLSASFTLPYKVAADGLSAELKDGVLTVKLPKAPEAQPRKIAVKAG